jgi:hypothetical protein
MTVRRRATHRRYHLDAAVEGDGTWAETTEAEESVRQTYVLAYSMPIALRWPKIGEILAEMQLEPGTVLGTSAISSTR